jgi:hypothetical protein
MLHRAVWQEMTDVSKVLNVYIIALKMKAVSTSETSVNLFQTKQLCIPEDSHLR